MMTQSSIDNMTQLQISNHASSTAKRLNKIIQSSNVYNSHYNNDDNQHYLIEAYQCKSSSKTPKAIPSFLKREFKDFLSLGSGNEAKNGSDLNNQCEHLKTEIKFQPINNQTYIPSSDLICPLNEKLTLNPEIKKRIDDYKKRKRLISSNTIKTKSFNQSDSINNAKNKSIQVKKKIKKEIMKISAIQKDAHRLSHQLSKEILNDNLLPSISSSKSKAKKKTQVLLKISSAFLETKNKIGREKARQTITKAENDFNIHSSTVLNKAIDSLIYEDEILKTKLDLGTNSNDNNESKHLFEPKANINKKANSSTTISQINYSKESFENINLDQKFNYNDGLDIWQKTDKQKLLNKMKKMRSAFDDQSFLKEETKKNHILKSMYPLTPRTVKFSKINFVNNNIK